VQRKRTFFAISNSLSLQYELLQYELKFIH